MQKSIRLTVIALTWLSNVFEMFVTGVISQFDFFDIPSFTAEGLKSKIICIIKRNEDILRNRSSFYKIKINIIQKLRLLELC